MLLILVLAINALIVFAVRPNSMDQYVGLIFILIGINVALIPVKVLFFGHALSANRPKPPNRA